MKLIQQLNNIIIVTTTILIFYYPIFIKYLPLIPLNQFLNNHFHILNNCLPLYTLFFNKFPLIFQFLNFNFHSINFLFHNN